MNYKLEKFWNIGTSTLPAADIIMNYKLEKFWNYLSWATAYKIANEL